MECSKGAFEIEVDDDLGRLFELYDRMPERGAAAPSFDPRHSEMLSGFWVKGIDVLTRQIVHLQAVGLINLGKATLSEHLAREAWLYHPYGLSVCPERCSFPAGGAAAIGGQVCYQGEVWVRPGREGFQGLRLAQRLVRFAMLLSQELFGPDFIWAFVAEKNARVRFPQRSGYRHVEPDGAIWRDAAGEIRLREWLVWSDAGELVELAAQERNADILRPVAQHHEDRAAAG